MKKKILTSLMATMAVGATCAFAANPFVDVPTDSWAYHSVVELADAGIIQGVDGQYFQGERNITRYEAAEMTAKAMAHMDKASVEQRALINKLADEFADALNSLGVRVSNLEKKVGNVKLSGNARVRYQHQGSNDDYKNDNAWDYAVHLAAEAQVNDRTTVTYGITTDDVNFGSDDAASDETSNPYTEIAKVDYNFGGDTWHLTAGRTDGYTIGGERSYGYQYSDIFDGIELGYNNGKFAVTAGYGKFKAGSDLDNGYDLLGVKTGYGEIEGFFGGGSAADSAIGVYYNDFDKSPDHQSFVADNLWGAYGSFNFKGWNALVNYEKSKVDGTDPEVWVGKLTYGEADPAAVKSWDAWLEYLDADKGAFYGSSASWRDPADLLDGVRSWGVGIDYTLAKNVVLSVGQTFGSEGKGGKADPKEYTDVEINFFF